MTYQTKESAGFTLIELSISIVIIGLIVAGVVAGQDLVKQAKLSAVITDIKKYQVSINTFKLKYDAIPGDISNANDYWSGCGSGASAAECNGDNDKRIEWGPSDNDRESYRLWQHLALANLIPGTYLGVGAGGYAEGKTPLSPDESAMFFIEHRTGGGFSFGTTGNPLVLSSSIMTSQNWNEAISVTEAKGIDKKIDDGAANTGKLYGITGATIDGTTPTACSQVGSLAGGADYNLSSTDDPACILLLWLDKNP